MRWPLLYIPAILSAFWIVPMTNELLDQLSAARARISELRGYL